MGTMHGSISRGYIYTSVKSGANKTHYERDAKLKQVRPAAMGMQNQMYNRP